MFLRKIIPAVLALAALILFVTFGRNTSSAPAPAERDEGAFPDLISFSAETLDGGSFSQKDFRKYDVTMINIWSITCSPCRGEMPALAELASSLPDNVRIITVSLDGKSGEQRTREFMDEAGFKGITLVTGDGDLQRLMDSIQYMPTTIFVDSTGRNIGEAVIGAPPDPAGFYTKKINIALEETGADPI